MEKRRNEEENALEGKAELLREAASVNAKRSTHMYPSVSIQGKSVGMALRITSLEVSAKRLDP